jgi:hypothetical protein
MAWQAFREAYMKLFFILLAGFISLSVHAWNSQFGYTKDDISAMAALIPDDCGDDWLCELQNSNIYKPKKR